jgi:hypothetical protein
MDELWARTLFLVASQQIDGAEGVDAGRAGLNRAMGLRLLQHRTAMGECVRMRAQRLGNLVLDALRSAHGGCGLGHEQKYQERRQKDPGPQFASRVRLNRKGHNSLSIRRGGLSWLTAYPVPSS